MPLPSFSISGHLTDLHERRIFPACVQVEQGKISRIEQLDEAPARYLLPGFVDAHVHIESSMLSPARFAQMAVAHGTVATVSDPHEIANVCGEAGVQWMIENARMAPFKCFFGAPSCVPATAFETAGATLDAAAVAALLARPDIWYLSEMMNYPGVLQGDAEVLAKIAAAQKSGKPVDGHAPGLRGEAARQYAAAGISTDHECTTLDEALDKIAAGMSILIREGSAAKNFEALHPLIGMHPERVMFCSDDKHPDDLAEGHINLLVQLALAKGYDLFDVLCAACVHPVLHYRLPVGLLREGDPADFIVVPNLTRWKPQQTYINGELGASEGRSHFEAGAAKPINRFNAHPRQPENFRLPLPRSGNLRVIVAHDGQLVTSPEEISIDRFRGTPGENDILKLAVINRYEPKAAPALAFVKGFGLKHGAIASSIAHDCHNVIAVGIDDESICSAVNAVIAAKGGIAVSDGAETDCLPLPIAGLMCDDDGLETGKRYAALSQKVKALGSPLTAPFMTLSFMALLVIPSLKLSDKGLFDGEKFCFVDLVVRS
jgi:adenine deaminase